MSNDWIDLQIGFPEENRLVLIYVPDLPYPGIYQAKRLKNFNFILVDRSRQVLGREVSHWMECPDAPVRINKGRTWEN